MLGICLLVYLLVTSSVCCFYSRLSQVEVTDGHIFKSSGVRAVPEGVKRRTEDMEFIPEDELKLDTELLVFLRMKLVSKVLSLSVC